MKNSARKVYQNTKWSITNLFKIVWNFCLLTQNLTISIFLQVAGDFLGSLGCSFSRSPKMTRFEDEDDLKPKRKVGVGHRVPSQHPIYSFKCHKPCFVKEMSMFLPLWSLLSSSNLPQMYDTENTFERSWPLISKCSVVFLTYFSSKNPQNQRAQFSKNID